MFKPAEHNHNLSMMLSEVLQDIGVTETMVMKTRRAWLIIEGINNIPQLLMDINVKVRYFGSQSEASTTLGLSSDLDCLAEIHEAQVIQDWSQWQPDMKIQYLMVQDERTSPGYCLLQRLRRAAPLPVYDIQNEHHFKDSSGRVLLRHSFCLGYFKGIPINGPAQTVPGCCDTDFVFGIYCPSWPTEAIPWLQQQNINGWPTEHMKRYAEDQGCFVVPVGSKQGLYQDLEWRISTSLAERCLMHSLNITQIRCYILMKMVLKTFLKPICGEAVSSFMCKNILFYCIAGSEANNSWNEGSLLTRLNQCLQALLHCILTENCPHFVIPRNNLLAGKLSADVKCQLKDIICKITENIEQSLLSIQIDDLGHRLIDKVVCTPRLYINKIDELGVTSANAETFLLASHLIYLLTTHLTANIYLIQGKLSQNGDANVQYLTNGFSKLDKLYREDSDFEKVAASLLKPFLCTTIGSIKASADICQSRNISPDALKWFSWGLNSDVSSSQLKLASAMYCAGELKWCEIILEAVSQKMSHTIVQPKCSCISHPDERSADFQKLCFEKNEDIIKHNIAVCVTYTRSEMSCIPGQLKYEMYRSTKRDHQCRNPHHFWMDWAVVDSKPYMYFLQYKVYSQLHRPADQHRALDNLTRTIESDPEVGHRETALNLLGQCMEQKNWLQLAVYCYKLSLTLRGRNNAANWHVCRLLARLVRSKP